MKYLIVYTDGNRPRLADQYSDAEAEKVKSGECEIFALYYAPGESYVAVMGKDGEFERVV